MLRGNIIIQKVNPFSWWFWKSSIPGSKCFNVLLFTRMRTSPRWAYLCSTVRTEREFGLSIIMMNIMEHVGEGRR
jgi:hypothetical protein